MHKPIIFHIVIQTDLDDMRNKYGNSFLIPGHETPQTTHS